MLTILSMLIGFVSSLFPDVMKLFQDKRDKAHEIKLLELQLQQASATASYKLDEIGVGAYRDIVVAATQQQTQILDRASQWVVNLTASVRPTVTYLFVIAFVGFKMAMFFAAINPSLPWHEAVSYSQAMMNIWGEEETAILGGLLSYWFSDRTLAKRRSA